MEVPDGGAIESRHAVGFNAPAEGYVPEITWGGDGTEPWPSMIQNRREYLRWTREGKHIYGSVCVNADPDYNGPGRIDIRYVVNPSGNLSIQVPGGAGQVSTYAEWLNVRERLARGENLNTKWFPADMRRGDDPKTAIPDPIPMP
jgi:hypothetical protein